MRYYQHVDGSGRCGAQQLAFRCELDVAGQQRPVLTGANSEHAGAVVVPAREWRPRVQPLEIDAVPRPACAPGATDNPSRAKRLAACRACAHREAGDETGRAARVIIIIVTHYQQVDGAYAAPAEIWFDGEQRRI